MNHVPNNTMSNGRKTRLYLACPISAGDRSWNFYQSCRAQELLMRAGYAVFAPGLSLLHPNAWNISHKTWLDSDLVWVEAADLLVRLPGRSIGADMEVNHAKQHGIPVWHVSLAVLDHLFSSAKNNGEHLSRE